MEIGPLLSAVGPYGGPLCIIAVILWIFGKIFIKQWDRNQQLQDLRHEDAKSVIKTMSDSTNAAEERNRAWQAMIVKIDALKQIIDDAVRVRQKETGDIDDKIDDLTKYVREAKQTLDDLARSAPQRRSRT